MKGTTGLVIIIAPKCIGEVQQAFSRLAISLKNVIVYPWIRIEKEVYVWPLLSSGLLCSVQLHRVS
jgi:hypothetical protein